MDAIETAIRNAFGKGDPLDPAYRQRVYRSAVAATEKALQANPSLTAEQVEQRRDGVRATIAQIESEFTPAVEGDHPVEPPAPSGAAAADDAPPLSADRSEPQEGYAAAPTIVAERRMPHEPAPATPRIEREAPRERRGNAGELGGAADGIHRSSRMRGGWATRLLPVLLVLVAAGAAIWWAGSSGFFAAPEPERRVGSQEEAAGPQDGAGGPLLPPGDAARDWITVFSPDNASQVNAPPGADAEVMEDDSGRFVRIRSGAGGEPVSFVVGQGILERMAGRRAVFDIVARTEEGTPTEMAVECNFGGLGDCGRKRYLVNYQRGDFLFEVELPEGQPASGGSIAIASDVDNAGKAVDVYEIRVAFE